jgi:hypothetical protein
MRFFLTFIIVLYLSSFPLAGKSQDLAKTSDNDLPGIVFNGSTPGNDEVKSLLNIPAETNVDFIRWKLTLLDKGPNRFAFHLTVDFGEAQPNTSGLKGGGEKRSFDGQYYIVRSGIWGDHHNVYQLESRALSGRISLVRLSDNVLHLLSRRAELMVGNGGWSYTLNRQEPVVNTVPLQRDSVPNQVVLILPGN